MPPTGIGGSFWKKRPDLSGNGASERCAPLSTPTWDPRCSAPPSPPLAGERFFARINKGRGRLVGGGKLFREIEEGSHGFRAWASQAVRAGTTRIVDEGEVRERTARSEHEGVHRSDDLMCLLWHNSAAPDSCTRTRRIFGGISRISDGSTTLRAGSIRRARAEISGGVISGYSAGETCAVHDRLRSRYLSGGLLVVAASRSLGPPGRTTAPGTG